MDQEKKISMVRYRGSKLSKLKEIDLFPKVEEAVKETSSIGGTFSIACFFLISWLIYSEVNYYLHSKLEFKFSPDVDFDQQLKLNVDLTIATPCDSIGADILDSTNQNAFRFGALEEESTWYELSPNQKTHFESKKYLNSYLREEYHALQEVLWRSTSSLYKDMPARTDKPNRPHDACRIYGVLMLNKVAGNFHITVGKSLTLPHGHIHVSSFRDESEYNFTHRIDRLSFGDPTPGIIHPLEGDENISNSSMTLFQYFIEVVPTDVQTFLTTVKTYQYSVKELSREIDHFKGSHGMPGIFFKYDMSALKITVKQERDHITLFLARLCSIVGGIYVCSGFINRFVQFLYTLITCSWDTTNHSKKKGQTLQANIILSKDANIILSKDTKTVPL